jgi:hypothetical protein
VTPAIPARPRNIGRPDAAFLHVNGVGIATSRVFGAESSRPASLLCTLRTHQSPSEWQHSLPARLLALAVRDLHPLDSIKGETRKSVPLPRQLALKAYNAAEASPSRGGICEYQQRITKRWRERRCNVGCGSPLAPGEPCISRATHPAYFPFRRDAD